MMLTVRIPRDTVPTNLVTVMGQAMVQSRVEFARSAEEY